MPTTPQIADLEPAARQTLVLTRESIAQLMAFGDYVAAVEDAFDRHASGATALAQVVHIPGPGGGFHIKSAALRGTPAYVAVKVNANFPENPRLLGLPTVQGVVALLDGQNGFPLAILDSMEVTTQRTAAATAVAAKYLARPDSRVATVIGCGVQGRMQLEALLHVLPIEVVYAFDQDAGRSESFVRDVASRTECRIVAVKDLASGTCVSDAIVTCTPARSAFLGPGHVRPGTFIAAVGADNDDKQEIEPTLMGRSKVVVDILEQCERIGDLHHALEARAMKREDVCAELGEVVHGAKPGRADSSETFIFDSTGSAIQDVAAARVIYERARAQGLGVPVRFP